MSYQTKQLELWRGPFGDEYVTRNRLSPVDVTNRMAFWERAIKQLYLNSNSMPETFLEVGAGQGANLQALDAIYKTLDKSTAFYATEVNEKARSVLTDCVPGITIITDLSKSVSIADCVFTMGVLIHIHPGHIARVMGDIYRASKKWIICAEYFSPTTRSISYHGEADALWADDFGGKWLDDPRFSLRLVGYGFLWKRVSGLDNLTFWLMEKTS
jgi:pseudaminic acid biosynthesis-associated methylase